MSLNFNQTNVTNFRLDIPDADITQAFSLNISSALIPGISIPVTNTPLGNKGLGRAQLPGSTIKFDPLMLKVLVDENLDAWTDIYTWMLSINNYITHDNNGWKPGVLPEFITLHILNNDKTDIVMSIHYYGAWPQHMSDLEFDFAEDTDPAIYVNVAFCYKYYAVEKNGVIIESRQSITDVIEQGKPRG